MNAGTSTAELKNELHKLVVKTEDPQMLRQIKSIFVSLLHEEGEDWWDTISEKEKSLIQSGLQQLENGEGIPHQTVREELVLGGAAVANAREPMGG